ncbi:hypothetical protein GJU35_44520 [Streptomyces lincolnensis]|nr:hypothetical protein GJU35_00400 [Streptomyces lincolnensis]QMV12021.1 hypothetical protein GJU35_44520 [Streptomyces lincolnensis]
MVNAGAVFRRGELVERPAPRNARPSAYHHRQLRPGRSSCSRTVTSISAVRAVSVGSGPSTSRAWSSSLVDACLLLHERRWTWCDT